jgi:hypothetical protein
MRPVERAAVLIGVNRTGGLPALQDAARGARDMEAWAKSQGIQHVEVITDEAAPVEIGDIKRAIRQLCELGTIEHLAVYFAGHGINVNRGERWLLTDAPADPQAAVNVTGSVDLARYGRIPYVVVISDACRTAAQGLRAQSLTGSEIFPNDEVTGGEQFVDQFYACRLGRPSFEIRDPIEAGGAYRAIYTSTLLGALEGARRVAPYDPQYVRPRPLRDFVAAEVERRIVEGSMSIEQTPDAHIASDPDAWVAELKPGGVRESPPEPGAPSPSPDAPVGPVARAAHGLLRPLLFDDLPSFQERLRTEDHPAHPAATDMFRATADGAEPFGPTFTRDECGFVVRGARFIDVFTTDPGTERLDDTVVRIPPGQRLGSVLLVLDGGVGLSLPALDGFVAAVTVEEGEVTSVAYEPTKGSFRWEGFMQRAQEVRALRAVASAASRDGVFAFDRDDAYTIARQLQYMKSVDPALAIYAAYAYADLGRSGLIRRMGDVMARDLGAPLFDLALLGRRLAGQRVDRETKTLSFMPLLAQGWALLGAHRISLPESLEGIERTVLPSLWTLLDHRGADMVRHALSRGDVR